MQFIQNDINQKHPQHSEVIGLSFSISVAYLCILCVFIIYIYISSRYDDFRYVFHEMFFIEIFKKIYIECIEKNSKGRTENLKDIGGLFVNVLDCSTLFNNFSLSIVQVLEKTECQFL